MCCGSVPLSDFPPFLVPGPDVSITGRSGTLYAGSRLTLTCTFLLGSALEDVVNVVVTGRWFGRDDDELPPTADCEGERVCVSAAEPVFGILYVSSVVFNTLRTTDSGGYNCTATVSIEHK